MSRTQTSAGILAEFQNLVHEQPQLIRLQFNCVLFT